MKKVSRTGIIIAIILSVIFLMAGFIFYGPFYVKMLPKVAGVKYLVSEPGHSFRNVVLFAWTLGLIPIISFLIWKYGQVTGAGKRMLTILIIILNIFLPVMARRQMIKAEAQLMANMAQISKDDTNTPAIESLIPMEHLHFEIYAFAGLLAGSVIAFYTVRSGKEK